MEEEMLEGNQESDAVSHIMCAGVILYVRYTRHVFVFGLRACTQGDPHSVGASSSRECCGFSQPAERPFDRDRENVRSRRLRVEEESHKM